MRKRKAQGPPEPENASKKAKVVPESSLAAADTAEESVESDGSHDPTTSLTDSITVDDRSFSKTPCQESTVRELGVVSKSVEISGWVEGQRINALAKIAGETADADEFDSVLVQQSSPVAASHFDEAHLGEITQPDALGQSWASHHTQDTAISPDQVDLPSPTEAPSTSPSAVEEIPSPTLPSPSPPHACHETIVDYRNGQPLPNSYLTELRRPVDQDFTNPHWGDAHYFRDPTPFRYPEAFKPDPFEKADDESINTGLQRLAARVPAQPMQRSWTGAERSLSGGAVSAGVQKSGADVDDGDGSMMAEEMRRRLRARLEKMGAFCILPLDLEPRRDLGPCLDIEPRLKLEPREQGLEPREQGLEDEVGHHRTKEVMRELNPVASFVAHAAQRPDRVGRLPFIFQGDRDRGRGRDWGWDRDWDRDEWGRDEWGRYGWEIDAVFAEGEGIW